MSINDARPGLSRRTALTGIGTTGLGLAFAIPHVAAQETATLAGHPLTGTWLVMTPGGVVPQMHGADGSVVMAPAPNYVDPALGLTYQGAAIGVWEADGERNGHFTVIQVLADANGTYAGTFQFEGFPEVSADGQTFSGTKPQRIIVRDAANTVIFDDVVSLEAPVTATRMGPTMESVVLPVVPPSAATPTT